MKSGFVTGGAKGLGLGCVRALASRGYGVTVVDVDEEKGHLAVKEALALGAPSALFFPCDVQCLASYTEAFEKHVEHFGTLDVCVLNAGIGGERPFLSNKSHGEVELQRRRRIFRINLEAQVEGTRLAHQHMVRSDHGSGSIVLVASSGGIYPMPFAPIYASSKGGVVQFVRSLAGSLASNSNPNDPKSRRRIYLSCFCPAYIDTDLVRGGMKQDENFKKHVQEVSRGHLLSIDEAGEIVYKMSQDKKLHGKALYVRHSSKHGADLYTMKQASVQPYYAPMSAESFVSDSTARKTSSSSPSSTSVLAVPMPVPKSYKKMQVVQLSDNFRKAVKIVDAFLPPTIPAGCVLMKRLWLGINASDVNFSAGRYFGQKAAQAMLPFEAGFESVGLVAGVGSDVGSWRVGMPVACMQYGAFSEYGVHKARTLISVPEASPQMVAFLTSGLTASIALEQARMRPKMTVLVTAAAGGTGQFAVQLAKLSGCHVIATCGNREKASLLKEMGADRVVLYKEEDLATVLRKEYKKGVDLVYDGVGGSMFEAAVSNIAAGGVILIIGMIGQYTKGWPRSNHKGVNEMLLFKNASVQGFFLLHHTRKFKQHLRKLNALYKSGQLVVKINSVGRGMDSVIEAVEYLHSGKSQGKVVVPMATETASKL